MSNATCHSCGKAVPLNEVGRPIFGISIETKGVTLDLCIRCFAGALREAALIFLEKNPVADLDMGG